MQKINNLALINLISLAIIEKATLVVSSNPVQGELYSIQHYMIKFVCDLRQVSDFLLYSGFLEQIKVTAMI